MTVSLWCNVLTQSGCSSTYNTCPGGHPVGPELQAADAFRACILVHVCHWERAESHEFPVLWGHSGAKW